MISIWNRLDRGAHACGTGRRTAPPPLTQSEIIADGGDLVKIWGQRGTLHVYHIDDWPVIVACVGDVLVHQRLERVPDADLVRDRVRDVADRLLADGAEFAYTDRHDPITSRSIRMLLTLGGYGGWGLAASRVNRVTAMRRRQAWTSTAWRPPPTPDALRGVALRYFATYGPASEADFRYMMGLRARLSRDAVAVLLDDGDLDVVDDGLLLPSTLRADWNGFRADPVPLRMLYCFDAVLLAHVRKHWLIREEDRARIWTRNGIVHGVVLVDGFVAGRWTLARVRDGVRFVVTPFPVMDGVVLDRDAAAIQLAGIAACLQASSYAIDWEDTADSD